MTATKMRDQIATLIFNTMLGRSTASASTFAADMIIAALPGMLPEIIPPMEWGETSYGLPECKTIAGVYRIQRATNGGYTVTSGRSVLRASDGRSNFPSIEAAQAAASDDLAVQILAALGIASDIAREAD